ncbi:MAG: hypothetical protein L6V88_07875 [Anaerotruncus sp.]|nr:MAG: hypothetical protein L6V88_07875 [Anaerotruncus sp.]
MFADCAVPSSFGLDEGTSLGTLPITGISNSRSRSLSDVMVVSNSS